MKVAVLGLGGMGRALAERAQDRGHEVVVWNRTKGKGGRLREADSTEQAAAAADAVVVVVHDDAAVREVCTAQLLAGLPADTHLMIASTVAPEVVRELDTHLPGRVLDTPVLGSPEMVQQGQGQFFVGGGDVAVHATSALLDDLGAAHVRCGGVGSGAVMKILSNVQLVVGVGALAEAVATARANGIRDEVVSAVFGRSVVVSEAASLGLRAMLDPQHRDGILGPAGDATYDVQLALELAGELPLVLSPGALDLLARIADDGWADFSAIIEGIG